MLAVLTAMMMTGCQWNEDPVRVSLDIDSSDLTLYIGESSTRTGSSKAAEAHFTYSTDNPSVATVDKDGEVTARSIGEATITVHMDENRKDWYASTDRTYRVIVKAPSTEKLRRVDRDTPLTLVALEDGKITITFNNGITLSSDIIYTINVGAEQTISRNTKGSYDITLKKNDFVQLFSENDALSSGIVAGARGATRAVDTSAKYINIKPAMKTEIYGNVMSMLEGDFFDDDCEIDADYALYGLFAGAEKLENNLFRHIELPAYELTDGCYQAMFYGCKGLQRAPDLPAGAMSGNCYKEMFAGCSKLSYVKCLADDISAEGCTKDWLADAGTEASSEKKVATTFAFPTNSNDGVPAGWTNEVLYPVKSVTLDKTSLEMIAGSAETGTAILTATVGPEYASDKTVFWLTSNEKVATVDDDGKVTAVGSGEAKITATAGGKHASCTVKVTVLVNSITLDKTELDMKVGDNPVTLTATVIPDGATDKTVTWSSSNEKAATVDANGKVTAIGNGETTITATAGGKTATCKVKVAMIINLATLTGNRTANNGDVLTGTLGDNYKISIAGGATVTLNNVTIIGKDDERYKWGGINCEGDATIILEGTNNLKGFYEQYPGIFVPWEKTLTIKGSGSLNASSNGDAAGIGGGTGLFSGNIVIEGGTITANGAQQAAGIGCGYEGHGGYITITEGVTKVTATIENELALANCIGAGYGGACGKITIGGTVYWDGNNYQNNGNVYLNKSPLVYPSAP